MDLRATFSLIPLLLLGLCCAQEGINYGTDDETSENDVTSTILKMNNGSRDFLLEGDMLISPNRNAMKCLNEVYSCLWEKNSRGIVEVPFLISEDYDDTERRAILSAMESFKKKTCIRFVPRRNQKACVSIQSRFGCFSSLGRLGHKQVVSLQKNGCLHRGIIQHELLHSLGFYHEHTRSDRDQYVKINWENLHKLFVLNFQKKDSNTLNTAYDYTSVMHYGRTAFGKNRKETIIPIPDSTAAIGQRDEMSEIDILRINKLYKC